MGATLSRGVWVDGLENSIVAGLVVLVGFILSSTVATFVDFGVALDKLLLRERNKFTGGDEVSTLEGSSCGESPA